LQLGVPAGELWTDGGSGFAVLGALLAVPVVAAVRFLGYVDLRTRKEGWDIQLRFVALAEQSTAGRRRARGPEPPACCSRWARPRPPPAPRPPRPWPGPRPSRARRCRRWSRRCSRTAFAFAKTRAIR